MHLLKLTLMTSTDTMSPHVPYRLHIGLYNAALFHSLKINSHSHGLSQPHGPGGVTWSIWPPRLQYAGPNVC